ncbi:unnamed protein product [Schistosoma curassoni]|nr:unnamed protein product [Schistosoma curassoni]
MIILQIYVHLLKLSSLSLISILLVSSTNLSYPTNSVKSLLPRQNIISPEDHLIEIISNNSINYGCDFNKLQFCSYEHSSDWSFQLSLTEFALKMKEAAETAAKVVQNFQETLSQNNNTNNTTRTQAKISSNQYGNFPSIIIPTVNYFPCSTNHNQYSYIKLPIHWPKYFITHQPIIPIDVTISNLSQSSSTMITSSQLSRQKRSIIYHHHHPINQSSNQSIPLYRFSKLYPIACLQLKIQFLSNNHNEDNDNRLDSQIVLSLGSNKQTIRNVFNIEELYANAYYEDYNDDDDDHHHLRENSETSSHTSSPPLSSKSSRIDWSIIRQEISDLKNNTLPYNVWINVSMPVYPTTITTTTTTTTTTDLNTLYNQTNHHYNEYVNPSKLHETVLEQSDHWIAIDSIQLLSIYSTNNVCIDDILLYTHQNRQFLKSTCQNKLIWISNNKQSNHSIQILYLNSNGYPILLNRTNSSSLSSQSNHHHHHHKKKDRNNFILQSFKSIYSKKYPIYRSVHMIWIAGSLLLAVFITFLAILFIITFSLSVMCNQRKTINTIHLSTTNSTTENNISSRNEKCKNNMPLLYEPHNRRKFYLNHYNKENCNNELLRILPNNLSNNSFLIDLHNHLSSSSLHGLLNHHQNEGKQQNNSQQIIITSTTHQQFVDDNSTELSLCMQDDKNEFLRSIDRKIVDNSDVSTTSAIQLLRNWNFYKQRSTSSPFSSSSNNNNPIKQSNVKHNTSMLLYMDHHHDQPLFGKGYTHSNIIANNLNRSNFNDKLEENVMYRCQSRNDTSNLPTISNIRQSLILSINDKNEFILLPSSNAMNQNEPNPISSTMNNHSSTLGMLNSLSEEDAEATRLEMAASVGALDQQYLQHNNSNNNNNDNTLDHLDYTLSTIPHSSFIRNDNERPPPSYHDSSP